MSCMFLDRFIVDLESHMFSRVTLVTVLESAVFLRRKLIAIETESRVVSHFILASIYVKHVRRKFIFRVL